MGVLGSIAFGFIGAIFGILMGVLCVTAPICMFRTFTKINPAETGSGKNTRVVDRGVRRLLVITGITLVLGIARMAVQGWKDIFSIVIIAVNVICLTAMVVKASAVKKADALNKRNYRKLKQEDAADELQHKRVMTNAKAQLNADKAMATAGTKVVKAKVGTAVAQENAKKVAVQAATAHMAIGAIAKPGAALEYAQASGALSEGKELADKMADGLMGDMAPTVIDGQYRDVTDEAKAMMSAEDAAFMEHIKSMSRDAIDALLRKGAEALMFETEGLSSEEIADNIIRYAPEEYLKTLPDSFNNVEKAVALVERRAQPAV